MHTRRVTRYHPARTVERNPSWWQRLQLRGGAVLLTLAITAICVLLVWAPRSWAQEQILSVNESVSNLFAHDLTRVEEHWINLPQIHELKRGDEPAIQHMLAEQPLLVAVMERTSARRLWLRQGEVLVPGAASPEADRYRQWITLAETAGRFQWTPPLAENTDPALGPALVLMGERFLVVKRWQLGSPEVEKMLRQVLGPNPKMRAGLRRTGDPGNASLKRQRWGAEPNIQADPARLADPFFAYQGTSPSLEGWDVVAIPFNQEGRVLLRQVIRQIWWVITGAVAVAVSLGMGLWLRRRARQRATLDADRLASLTHSLKTPLSILKFRCDSIRLGRLSPDQADAELIKVGEEVDHLTLMIENGLEAIRGVSETGPQGEVSAAWLSRVAEDLAPAFEAEGKTLQLDLTSDSGRAALPSLRSSVLTLLENALYHGGQEVTLQTARVRRRFQIRVRDTGTGLEEHQLEALGKPFLRLRNQGKEGFEREGQGLGLSLLVQVAQKEGWGLTFASAPGGGFLATIEIRAL
jgi:signal transduction histidine kinase